MYFTSLLGSQYAIHFEKKNYVTKPNVSELRCIILNTFTSEIEKLSLSRLSKYTDSLSSSQNRTEELEKRKHIHTYS